MNKYEMICKRKGPNLPEIIFEVEAKDEEEAKAIAKEKALKFELLKLRELNINVFDNNPPGSNFKKKLTDEEKVLIMIDYIISKIPAYQTIDHKKMSQDILNMIILAAFENTLFFNAFGIMAITKEKEDLNYRIQVFATENKTYRIKFLRSILDHAKKVFKYEPEKLKKLKIIYQRTKYNFRERTYSIKLLEKICQYE